MARSIWKGPFVHPSLLKKIDKLVLKRTEIANWYKKNLDNVMPLKIESNVNSSWHLFIIRVMGGKVQRNKLIKSLINLGIEVNIHYIPVYRHPYHESSIRLLESEKYYNSALSIPIFPSITKIGITFIIIIFFK